MMFRRCSQRPEDYRVRGQNWDFLKIIIIIVGDLLNVMHAIAIVTKREWNKISLHGVPMHRIQEGGRQNWSVSTMPQPLWVCTLRGKISNYRTSVMVLHLNQSSSMDTLWRSMTSLSTWAALLTPLVTLILTFFDESALHHQWWASWTVFGARTGWALLLSWGSTLHVSWQ